MQFYLGKCFCVLIASVKRIHPRFGYFKIGIFQELFPNVLAYLLLRQADAK